MTASATRVRIGRLPERPAGTREPSEFNGLGPLARLPKRLVVRRADIDGTIELLVADDVVVDGSWALRGSGLGPAGRAEAALEASLDATRGGEPLAAAVVTAAVAADIDGAGAVTLLTADAALYPGPDEEARLRSLVTASLDDDAESYRLELAGSGGRRLIEATARLDPRSRRIEADWTAEITPDQLATFTRGRGLPELAATSAGSLSLDLGERRLQVDAGGRFEGRGWADLDPRLAEVGDLVADAAVAGTLTGRRLEARQLRLAVIGADGREVLRVGALQPVVVDLDRWRIDPERWGEPALRLVADRMPLRWVRGLAPGVDVEGGVLSLALDVVPIDAGHASLETHQPIRLTSLKLRTGAGVDLPPLDLTVEPRISLDQGSLEAAIERARVTMPTGLDLRFGGRAATSRERWPVVGLDGELSVSLPGVRRLIEEVDLVSGRVRLELDLDSMVVSAESADLDVAEADGHSLLAIRFDNEEPLRLALPTLAPDWASATPQRVAVVVDGFPVDWVSPFLPEIDLEGGALYGELRAVTGDGRGLSLESVAPFELRGLAPVYRGRPFATGSTASVEPRLELD
ncbi:MAG TPA: hypothetical protein VLT32_15140, partial [Candidatus Sulfomarinibacteraceae bacterium]|nr:hypothetical protein [Candidatus Sulfomarinibacteraceae bacterium]